MNLLKEENKKLVKGKTGRVYLIDSENINDVWVNLLNRLEEHDRIIVFYTDKSAHMSYEKVIRLLERDKGALTWIKCYEGQNALDFQLVSVLGAMIMKSSRREYIIVADDCGYDAAVKYWRRCKGRVSRMKSSECAKIAKSVSAEDEISTFDFLKNMGTDTEREKEDAPSISAKEKKKSDPASVKGKKRNGCSGGAKKKSGSAKTSNNIEADDGEAWQAEAEDAVFRETGQEDAGEETASFRAGQPDEPEDAAAWEPENADAGEEAGAAVISEEAKEFLRRLGISVSIKDKSLYHNALINLLGQDVGNQIYRALAMDKELRRSVRSQLLPTKRERVSAYLELILEKEGLGTADLDKLVSMFLQNPRASLQLMNIALVKKFGAEKGGNYYRIIKKQIKVLQSL